MSERQEASSGAIFKPLPFADARSGWDRLLVRLAQLVRPRRDPVVAGLERTIGLRVRNPELYKRALRHRSVMRAQAERPEESNERLEFLGDAVLGLAVARYLYKAFPERDEGFLTRIRSRLVNGEALADFARALGLSAYIEMSENMEQGGGRDNPSILADAFEAILGAVYLDYGLDVAGRFVDRMLDTFVDLDDLAERRENFKSLLLELAQSRGWSQPRYQVVWEKGPSHEREFCIVAVIDERSYERGIARSKKRAEQLAAARTYRRLRQEGHASPSAT